MATEKLLKIIIKEKRKAAGRAGRGEKPGEAIIQTYQPEHYSIQAAMHQDYRAYYEEEIGYRKLLGYPPVSNLIFVRVRTVGASRIYLKKVVWSEGKFI